LKAAAAAELSKQPQTAAGAMNHKFTSPLMTAKER
jgi:hypothetical protein